MYANSLRIHTDRSPKDFDTVARPHHELQCLSLQHHTINPPYSEVVIKELQLIKPNCLGCLRQLVTLRSFTGTVQDRRGMADSLPSHQAVRWIIPVKDFRQTFHHYHLYLRDDMSATDFGGILRSLLRKHVSRVELCLEPVAFAQKRCVLAFSSCAVSSSEWDRRLEAELTIPVRSPHLEARRC